MCLRAGETQNAIRAPDVCTRMWWELAGHLYVLVNDACVCLSVRVCSHVYSAAKCLILGHCVFLSRL